MVQGKDICPQTQDPRVDNQETFAEASSIRFAAVLFHTLFVRRFPDVFINSVVIRSGWHYDR